MDHKINSTIPRESLDHCLFQARMWRLDAMAWDLPDWHYRRSWVEKVLQMDRETCLRKARHNLIAARFFMGDYVKGEC